MFDHPRFNKYDFENVPLNCDIYLMDEEWMAEYERDCVNAFKGKGADEPIGYVCPVAVRAVAGSVLDLAWFQNVFDRFHSVRITLPKSQFITCVDVSNFDEKPRIFVKRGWLESLYGRAFSVFAMIDASDVKAAIGDEKLTRPKLVELRDRIDRIASSYPQLSFISFADSLLLKSNWLAGRDEASDLNAYRPETFLKIFAELKAGYAEILSLPIYGVFAQGSNEYYEDTLLHISRSGNHISLNSIGLPFAQLQDIEAAARKAIRCGHHDRKELYMDSDFFHSLKFRFGFEKNGRPQAAYTAPMAKGKTTYFYEDLDVIVENLLPDK